MMNNIFKVIFQTLFCVFAVIGSIVFIFICIVYGMYLADCMKEDDNEPPTYVEIIFNSLPEEKDIKSKSSGFGQGCAGVDILYYDDISDYFLSEKNQFFFPVGDKTSKQLKEFISAFTECALFKFDFDYGCIDRSDWVAFINPEWKSEDEVGDEYVHASRSFIFFDSQTNKLYYFFQEL